MGSPLAPFLANLFMEDFEEKLLKKFPGMNFWTRYVDDVFASHNLSERLLDKFLKNINSINKRIQFTIEPEMNKQLPFLDMLIIRTETGFKIDVYRKPTFCKRFIPEESYHPKQQKLSFLYSSIYRIFECALDEEAKERELVFLRDCCLQNGIDVSEVDRIFAKIKYKIDLRKITSLDSGNVDKPLFIGLTFNNFTQKISRLLKKFNIATGFKTNNSLKSHLPTVKDKILLDETSGVYKASCGDCNKFYIGQTRRAFKVRWSEHLKYPEKSNFCSHLLLENHNPNLAQFEVLVKEDNLHKLNVREQLFISRFAKTCSDQLLNDKLEPCSGSLVRWLQRSSSV